MNTATQLAVRYSDAFAEKWVEYLSPSEWRDKVTVEFREVPIRQLEPAGSNTDPEVVNGWVERLRGGAAIPPPVGVETARGTYYLHDGNHRYLALREYLGSDDHVIRIAVAVPRAGYKFSQRTIADFSTYLLERDTFCLRTFALWALIPVMSAIAVLLTRGVPNTERSPFFVFLVVSVLVSARLAGWLAGLVATVINLTAAAYLFLPPVGSVNIADRTHFIHFAVTAATMMIASIIVGLNVNSPVWRMRFRHRK